MNYIVSTSPHITKKSNSTKNIMLDVIIALSPSIIASIIFFGHLAFINLLLCVVFCFGLELLYNLIISKKWNKEGLKNNSVWDFSSLVTAIILALNLPTHIKVFSDGIVNSKGVLIFSPDMIFICFLGSLVAIVLVKMLFGGIGKNFANPAATARIFIFIAFGMSAVSLSGWIGSATTSATPLSDATVFTDTSLLDMFIGRVGSGAIGETSVIAILVGYIYLCIRRVIDFKLPLMVLLSAFIFAILFQGLPNLLNKEMADFTIKSLFDNSLRHILSGGLIFGAVFMATDYSTSPNTLLGSIIFALGIGLFTMLIRIFGIFPEGVSFAIVIMNILVPIIDKYIVNKPFGYAKTKNEAVK